MNGSEPLRVLIADPSQNTAEELASELRNAGFATRNQHVADAQDLDAALGRQRWDLLVVRRDPEMEYDPAELIRLARRDETDFPILLVEDGTEIERLTAGIEAGATDVLLAGEDDRFMLVLRRELANLHERRGRRHAEVTMLESERRNQLLLDSSRAAIAYVHEGMHIYANRAYVELFGYGDAEDLEAMPLMDMIDGSAKDEFKARLKSFTAEAGGEEFPIRGVREDGGTFDGIMTLTAAAYEGEHCMQVLIRREESAAASSEEVQRLRAQDPITGLLNRPFFIESLSYVLEGAREDEAKRRALAVFSIDDPDRFAEEAGLSGRDQVLKEIAQCLRATLGEAATIARLSDEEFAAVLDATESEAAEAEGERVRAAVADLLASAGEKTLRLTMSVGIALIGDHSRTVSEVVDQAYRAVSRIREKDAGGNAVYVFDTADFVTAPGSKGAADDDRAREILRLLSEGIKNNTLVLLFQPVVSLRGEDTAHYEVFLRLPDGDGNLLRPDEFMELAEAADMGGKVDRWVVLNAVKRLTQHRAEGHDTRLTINLTHAALTDDAFLNWLKVALKAAKLPREAVIMQYSEDAATTYMKQAKTFGEAMAEMDCRLGLSHFGASSNPFDTLRHLKVDFVKLDGSYIRELEASGEKQETLREMIGTLEEQGKIAIVPMVSNAQVLASLFSSGANYVQGNYFCEPGPEMDYDFSGE
jgi:diguanylate cyclase (GGDEF)-like protein/PAS domain S-box-containing protein